MGELHLYYIELKNPELTQINYRGRQVDQIPSVRRRQEAMGSRMSTWTRLQMTKQTRKEG